LALIILECWVNFIAYGTVIFLIIIFIAPQKVKNITPPKSDVNYKSEYFRNIGKLQSN